MTFKDSIVLYKTPLDADYANVYDDYETTADYVSFLNNFTHITVTLTTDRTYSRKNVDDLFEFVIDGYDSMDLHDYNYMKFITAKNEIKFAFILSVDSENDNQTNPSVLLHCKLDVWSNHYLELKNSFNLVQCSRATLDTNVSPCFPTSIKNIKPIVNRVFSKFVQSNNNKYCILWQRLVLSDYPKDAFIPPNETIEENKTYIKGSVMTGGSFVCYRPSAILQCVDNKFSFVRPLNFVKLQVYGHDYSYNDTLFSETVITGIPTCPPVYGSVVISNSLTFTVPFTYTINEPVDEPYNFTVDMPLTMRSVKLGNITDGLVVRKNNADIVIVDKDSISTYGCWFTPLDYGSTLDDKKINISLYQGKSIYDSRNRNVATPNNAILYETITKEYPFNYYTICVGSQIIPVTGFPSNYYMENNSEVKGAKLNLEYNSVGKLGASLLLYYDNNSDFRRITVNNTLELDIASNAYDEYMLRNMNSYMLSVGSGILKAITGIATIAGSVATGNPVGIAAGGASLLSSSSVLSDIATLNDLKNNPDKITHIGLYPQTNIFDLDLVMIFENNCIIENNSYYGKEIYNYHSFGIDTEISQTLTKKNREFFDYIEGKAVITAEISNDDKKELENAVANGITKWHLSNHLVEQEFPYIQILKYMNKNSVNYSISLIQ